jgi:4-amino-4-deoxy-L-arabinose transferase-like glycosyltransferase
MLTKYKVLVVIFLAAIVFGLNVNSYPLKNWDEAWYAEITKNMALKGTGFLMPFWNGDFYFDKPPLYFWLTTPVVKTFGEGQWQMRIISVIFAVIATLALYLIAKKLFNEKAAFWTAIIFVSFGQVAERFGSGNLDALMISLMLLSVLFYLNKKLFWVGVWTYGTFERNCVHFVPNNSY